jgi:hypothetical protein
MREIELNHLVLLNIPQMKGHQAFVNSHSKLCYTLWNLKQYPLEDSLINSID